VSPTCPRDDRIASRGYDDEIQRITEIERITNGGPSYLDNGRGILCPHARGHRNRTGKCADQRDHLAWDQKPYIRSHDARFRTRGTRPVNGARPDRAYPQVVRVVTVGIFSGRGSFRDQFGRAKVNNSSRNSTHQR
jgi:hypothetical protein